MVSVAEIMKTNVVTADPETNVIQLARIMTNNQIGSVVIKDLEKDEPLGIVTWSAIITLLGREGNPYQEKAKNLIKKKLITVDKSKSIIEAAKIMVKNNVDRLPVTDNGKLIGILSYKDILASTPELIEIMSEKLKATVMRPPEFGQIIEGICEDCGDYSRELSNIGARWVCKECTS